MEAFNPAAFDEEVSHIEVTEQNKLNFIFKNGENIEMIWEHPSRSESWSLEARERARERAREISLQKCKEMSYASS